MGMQICSFAHNKANLHETRLLGVDVCALTFSALAFISLSVFDTEILGTNIFRCLPGCQYVKVLRAAIKHFLEF